jgi:hypothetical protein
MVGFEVHSEKKYIYDLIHYQTAKEVVGKKRGIYRKLEGI